MTDTPEVNDIPEILARAKDYLQCRTLDFYHGAREDVPNMAAEILSLRAQVEQMKPDFASSFMRLHQSDDELLAKKRLDVLEELRASGRLQLFRLEKGMVGVALSADAENAKVLVFDSFTSCGNDELSRREKE